MKSRLLYILLFCCAIFLAHQYKSEYKKHLTELSAPDQKNLKNLDIRHPAIPDENVAYADDETNNDDNFGSQKLKLPYHTTPVNTPGLNCQTTIQCGPLRQFHDILKVNQPIYILLHQLLIHFTV